MKRLGVLAFCIAVAGCGGGGGGTTSAAAPANPATAAPTTAPAGAGVPAVPSATIAPVSLATPSSATPPPGTTAPSTSSQQQNVQSALNSLQAQNALVTYGAGNGSTLSFGRSVQNAMARRPLSTTGSCASGFVENITNTGPNAATVTDTYYYDAACSVPFRVITASVNLNTGQGSGSSTTYSPAGVIVEYDAIGLAYGRSSTVGAFAIYATASTSPAVSPYASYAIVCAALLAGGAATCNGAQTATVGTLGMVGVTATLSGTITYTGGGSVVNVGANDAFFTGGIGALAIVPSGGVWVITGGSQIDAAAGSGTATYTTSGQITSASITVTDTVTYETVSVKATASGVTGTVSFGATPIASFSTDLSGNGTVTYANGSKGTIRGFYVVS